jgi:hypothetical protein
MRIIECPDCNGYGVIYECPGGWPKRDCYYCHGKGTMTVREWINWKCEDMSYRYPIMGIFIWPLAKLAQIGEKEIS